MDRGTFELVPGRCSSRMKDPVLRDLVFAARCDDTPDVSRWSAIRCLLRVDRDGREVPQINAILDDFVAVDARLKSAQQPTPAPAPPGPVSPKSGFFGKLFSALQ